MVHRCSDNRGPTVLLLLMSISKSIHGYYTFHHTPNHVATYIHIHSHYIVNVTSSSVDVGIAPEAFSFWLLHFLWILLSCSNFFLYDSSSAFSIKFSELCWTTFWSNELSLLVCESYMYILHSHINKHN